ncbi:retrovirus-related pol polyprotein from transposon TNT 1-94 [Tanacetum coccineum]
MEKREHGRMILESVENGPLIWPTIEKNGVTRTKKYAELSAAEKIQADCDTKATNIILQGLPADIYSLVNHHRFAKELWERVQLLMQGFVVLVFSPRDDPIACLNKAMAFLTVVASQDGGATMQQIQGRQGQSYSSTCYKSNATSSEGNNASGQAKVVKCYNCQGEGHMARQCTQTKRPRNAAWYKEKAMLVEAQKAGQILDEEQLAFLADPEVPDSQAVQTIIPNNAAFQTEDLDTYDFDCDDISNEKAVLMANISNYGSDIILEVPHSETYLNDMENQSVHAMKDFEQTQVANVQDTNLQAQQDSMILSVIEQMSEQMINHVNNWKKANKEQNNESVTAELERYKERVKTFEQRLNIDLSSREKMIDSQMDDMIKEKLALKEQVASLEQILSKQIKEKECYQNLFYLKKAQWIKPTLNDGIFISAKHVAMPVIDDEETLILEEENRSKMSEKEKDPEAIKQNITHKPIDYEKLNRLSEDFRKRFTPQQEFLAKQVFCLHMSNPTSKSSDAPPVKIEAPKELPKVFKDQFDSIKKTRVRTKELSDSLIDKLNLKYAENEDLKAQIQDKVFVITSLKNDLRKLKGKEIVDIAAQIPSANTIVPGMFKIDLKHLAPSNYGSKPTGNKKNDRISQTPSRNMKNKVEAQPRKGNIKNCVVEPIYDVDVNHSLLKANSELICATCKKSMFDGVHDMCLLDFVENVNSRAKSAKKHKKQNIWKPTGHVFIEVGLKWKPTGRTFTIVGNSCPLTRITSANIVPPKKTTSHSVETQKPELKVYRKKPKNVKNIPSSSSLVMTVRFENDHITRIIGYDDYQLGNVTISRVYYVKGIRHNLFSVGQFCDTDLEVAF